MQPDLRAVFVIQKDGLAAITQGDSDGECIINSCNPEPIPWPRGLRRGPGVARLLGMGGSNPAGGMDVCRS
jgi:hypothetical protein